MTALFNEKKDRHPSIPDETTALPLQVQEWGYSDGRLGDAFVGRRQGRRRSSAMIKALLPVPRKISSGNDDYQTGVSSSDGDYVKLREIRKKKANEPHNRKRVLDTIIDDIKGEESDNDIAWGPIKPEVSLPIGHVSPDKTKKTWKYIIDKWKFVFFSVIENDREKELVQAIGNAKRDGVELSDIVDNTTGMNVLHKALDIGSHRDALLMLEQGSCELLLQTFEVYVSDNFTMRNTLHLIAEKGTAELAEAFIQRVMESEGKRMIMQETSMSCSDQRPRTFPCLHIAAYRGNVELTKFFIDKGTPINHVNSKNDTALLWASRWDHHKVMRYLIKQGADPNLENDKGSTALYWAVRYNLPEAVQILVDGGANIDQLRKVGFVAPIVLASAFGYERIVKILLQAGADVNLEIHGGETALHHAAREGNAKVAEILINNGATINEQDEMGNTPLTLASKFDQDEVMDVLISHGATMTHKNLAGEGIWHFALLNPDNTSLAVLVRAMKKSHELGDNNKLYNRPPLCEAAMLGAIHKISFLIDIGLDSSESDHLGNNMIHYAAKENNYAVISQFKAHISLDSQNHYGDTPLHVSCTYGNVDAINVLVRNKAKADIKNNNGETALHVMARSPTTTADSMAKLVEYMIHTHSWNSLHAQDDDGNNALHIATMYASTSVLWEVRVVSTKTTNNNGCTPFHTAVIRERPEVLHTMLDIYEIMRREADLNSRNYSYETVLHLATEAGDAEGVSRLILYGADLAAQDREGDTVLHRLATKMQVAAYEKRYIEVIDAILRDLVRWWCLRDETLYPDEEIVLFRHMKRMALRWLISGIENKRGLTVINHCAQIGCKVMLDKILMVPHVNYFQLGETVRLDISHLIPTTNKQILGYSTRFSCIEMLGNMHDLDMAGRTLDVPSLKQVETLYANLCAWTYTIFMTLHIMYMCTFSWMSLNVATMLRQGITNNTDFFSSQTAVYVIVPIEPIVMILSGIVFSIKCVLESKESFSYDSSTIYYMFQRLRENMSVVAGFAWSLLTLVWLVLFSLRNENHLEVLAVCLWFGWLYSISFTRGFKAVHYFWRMLKVMVVRDVLKFFFVYLFVLMAFAFAMHTLIQVSSEAADMYKSTFDTLFMTFNLMLGMVWLFDDGFEEHIAARGRSPVTLKLFVMLYLILSTVVLLNVLIAMMNDSYQTIKNTQQMLWRVDSVRLGLAVERYLPWSTKFFTSVSIRRGNIDQSPDEETLSQDGDIRWYIDVESLDTRDYGTKDDVAQSIQLLTNQIDKVEKTVSESIRSMQEDMTEIRYILEEANKANEWTRNKAAWTSRANVTS